MPVFNNVLAGSSGQGTGYNIDQSLRFNNGDSAYLNRTAGTATSNDIGTLSFWTKRGIVSGGRGFFSNHADANNRTYVGFDANKIQMFGKISGSANVELVTEQVFRDPSAWYHVVIAIDVTQSTASNRVKFYINGSQVTDFSTSTYPAQDTDFPLLSKTNMQVGAHYSSSIGDYYDGYLAEFYFIDGQALAPASFGETNSDTNQWQAIEYDGSYGDNGFYLKFGGEGFLTYDRESEIAVTSNQDWTNSAGAATSVVLDDLVNGVESNDDAGGGWAYSAWAASGSYIRFDFGSAKTYKNAQWRYINSSGTEGSWKWQGSNNASDWTDIGSSFTLSPDSAGVDGVNRSQEFTSQLGSNTTAYRYYQILGISGNMNTSGRRIAMYFSETAYGFGDDSSGEGNNFSENNLTWSDQVKDSPTNNFCTLNPLNLVTNTTLSEGNLQGDCTSSNDGAALGTMSVSSGKWYWEVLQTTANANNDISCGVMELSRKMAPQAVGADVYPNAYLYGNDGWNAKYNSTTSTINTYGAGDIIGWALDLDGNTLKIYKNNSLEYTYSSGVSGTFTPLVAVDGTSGQSVTQIANFGQDSSFNGQKTAQGNGGTGEDFYYSPPAGFKALNTNNLSVPEIADPTVHFSTTLWSGNDAGSRSITTGVDADFVWYKQRNGTESHSLYDSIRGAQKRLISNSTDYERTRSNGLQSFDSAGFTVGSDTECNGSGNTYVGWNWKAAASNTSVSAGSIDGTNPTLACTRRTNTAAGFSIVSWEGTGSDGTVAHGLSQAPELIINKSRGDAYNWAVQSILWNSASDTNMLYLNTNAAQADDTNVFQAAPTSTVFSPQGGAWAGIGTDDITYIAYCFHSVEGYSKIGTYDGNNNADGAFIYTGFRPSFVMFKCTNDTFDWTMFDMERNPYNAATKGFWANTNGTDTAQGYVVDFVSNGIKHRETNAYFNANLNYMYIAFAESPFKYSNAR